MRHQNYMPELGYQFKLHSIYAVCLTTIHTVTILASNGLYDVYIYKESFTHEMHYS